MLANIENVILTNSALERKKSSKKMRSATDKELVSGRYVIPNELKHTSVNGLDAMPNKSPSGAGSVSRLIHKKYDSKNALTLNAIESAIYKIARLRTKRISRLLAPIIISAHMALS